METIIYIKIAEHTIRIVDHDRIKNVEHYCDSQFHNNDSKDTLLSFIENNYDCITSNKNLKVDFTIHLREQGYGQPFQNYDVEMIEDKTGKTYKRADYLIKINTSFSEVDVYAYDSFALKHAMLNIYSAFIVRNNWGLLMHASCVVNQETAHIFTGHSGAGKSTVAMLSAPRQLLSDEATIIRITDDEVIVYHSPFRSGIHDRAEKESYRLADVQLLRQATENKRIKMNQLKAYLELIDKVFFWTNDSNETTSVMKLLKKLVSNVPVYELYFEKNPSFWEVMDNEVHS